MTSSAAELLAMSHYSVDNLGTIRRSALIYPIALAVALPHKAMIETTHWSPDRVNRVATP
jgi:hypothetical protein